MQPENNGRENAAYAKGPLEDMTIQDAVTVIAVHAAQLDSNESEKDIQDIERILREHALFRDLSTDVRRLVNTYANVFLSSGSENGLTRAVRTLNASNTTDVAFEIAVEVAMTDGPFSRKKTMVLKRISSLLSIRDDEAERLIQRLESRY